MGFELPLALLALVAAGLPVIAHLLRRQDLPRRRLPTIALLRRAEASSRRRVRLVDLLLLIARILMIAVAAFAVAKPFVRVELAYGDGSVASVALVVDDSMSMAGRGDPSLLARALERAGEVVESLPAGSHVAVVMGGQPARVLVSRTEELPVAAQAIAAAELESARGTDLTAAIALADRELAGAPHADRRILVLSDFAAHVSLADAALPSAVDLRFERIGPRNAQPNAAIVEARATPDPTTPGRASIAVQITARELDDREVVVVLRRGAEEIARERVTIAQGGARLTLHAPIDRDDAGAEVAIEIDDALPMDDVRGVLMRPPTGARVLLVDGDPQGSRNADEARFISRAIDLAPDDGGALTRRTVDPDTFAAMELADVDVVVLANVPAPGGAVVQRLRTHVERGGGLWIAAGDHVDARAYVARFGDLLPATPRTSVATPIAGPQAAPGTELVPAQESGLEHGNTRQRLVLEAVPADAEVALVFADGSPALVVGRFGEGRVALLATTLDDDWTDLPFRPGFLPLTVRLLRRLAPAGSAPDQPIAPGRSIELRPPAAAVRMRLITPDGERIDRTGDELGDRVRFDRTAAPGIYRVEIATRERALREDPRMAFLVAPPSAESDLTPGPVPESAGPSDAGAPSVASVERAIAPWFFLLVGVLGVLEAALRIRAAHLARRAA